VLSSILKDQQDTDEAEVLLCAVSSLLLQASDHLSVKTSARLVSLVGRSVTLHYRRGVVLYRPSN
jgi:hypothetical protein